MRERETLFKVLGLKLKCKNLIAFFFKQVGNIVIKIIVINYKFIV